LSFQQGLASGGLDSSSHWAAVSRRICKFPRRALRWSDRRDFCFANTDFQGARFFRSRTRETPAGRGNLHNPSWFPGSGRGARFRQGAERDFFRILRSARYPGQGRPAFLKGDGVEMNFFEGADCVRKRSRKTLLGEFPDQFFVRSIHVSRAM